MAKALDPASMGRKGGRARAKKLSEKELSEQGPRRGPGALEAVSRSEGCRIWRPGAQSPSGKAQEERQEVKWARLLLAPRSKTVAEPH